MTDPMTHRYDGDVVVFNIGMILRKPHRVDLWSPVSFGMGRMIKELSINRDAFENGGAEHDLGFLGAETLFGPRGPWVVQYWRSVDHLYAYAHNRDLTHYPAWRAFNRAARKHPEAVGIWHETFAVSAENIETVYGNGGVAGLGRVAGTVPVESRGRSARERLGGGLRSGA